MLVELLILILLGISLKILLTSTGVSPEKIDFVRDKINYFVFYYVIPFICFKTTYTMPFSINHLKISIVANLTIISSVLVSWLIYKKLSLNKKIKSEEIGSLIMCSAFGNVLYIGLPVLTKLYGAVGMNYALTYDFLASTPLTWTLAVAVCMKYGKAKGIKLRDSLLTIIKIPPLWGLAIGFIFRELNFFIPEELISLINLVSPYITSLMLIIVGISIRAVTPQKLVISLPAIIIKLILSPLFALIYGILLGLSGITLNVCVIEAGMPSMLLSMIFATIFGVDMRTAIEMIFLTTLGFFLSGFIFILVLN